MTEKYPASKRLHITFILVEPETSGNVGSIARAMKTMGLSDLRVVNPKCDILDGKAKAFAHASNDLLENAKVFDSLEAATQDVQFLVACTARHRKRKLHYIDVDDIYDYLDSKRPILDSAAFVFGGETSGLKTEDVLFCDLASSIPLATKLPSLNLSQAAMIYAYKISSSSGRTSLRTKDSRIDINRIEKLDYKFLKDSIEQLLLDLKIPDHKPIFSHLAKGLSRLGYDDLYLVHQIRKRVSDRLKALEK